MDVGALCLILAAVVVWSMFSARAAAISTPIFFVATGIVMAQGLKLMSLAPDPHVIKLVAEVTLVWVLFADASRVGSPICEPTAAGFCGCWLWACR